MPTLYHIADTASATHFAARPHRDPPILVFPPHPPSPSHVSPPPPSISPLTTPHPYISITEITSVPLPHQSHHAALLPPLFTHPASHHSSTPRVTYPHSPTSRQYAAPPVIHLPHPTPPTYDAPFPPPHSALYFQFTSSPPSPLPIPFNTLPSSHTPLTSTRPPLALTQSHHHPPISAYRTFHSPISSTSDLPSSSHQIPSPNSSHQSPPPPLAPANRSAPQRPPTAPHRLAISIPTQAPTRPSRTAVARIPLSSSPSMAASSSRMRPACGTRSAIGIEIGVRIMNSPESMWHCCHRTRTNCSAHPRRQRPPIRTTAAPQFTLYNRAMHRHCLNASTSPHPPAPTPSLSTRTFHTTASISFSLRSIIIIILLSRALLRRRTIARKCHRRFPYPPRRPTTAALRLCHPHPYSSRERLTHTNPPAITARDTGAHTAPSRSSPRRTRRPHPPPTPQRQRRTHSSA